MADVVLAGILGAVVLAVVLLHKVSQKNREVLTQMRAEMAAQQIVALTSTVPIRSLPDETEEEPPEPARRKGHLALFIGGLAAVLAFAGSRAVALWRMHRTATVTVTAASVAVVGALVITTDEITPPVFVPPATAQSTTPGTVESQDASDQSPTAYSTTGPTTDTTDTTTFSTPGRQALSDPPAPGASGTRTPGDDSQAQPASSTPSPGKASSPGPSTPPTPTPSTPAPDNPADEPPTPHIPAENPPVSETPDTCDGLVYVELPPLLDACLL